MPETATDTLSMLKQNLIDYVHLNLGGDIVDIELDPAHYEVAYQRTIGTLRQRGQASTEESYNFLTIVDDVNEYTLPQ